jgi:hypothetical protein
MQQIHFIFQRTKENKIDLLHLVGILFIKPRCTETRNSNKKKKKKCDALLGKQLPVF